MWLIENLIVEIDFSFNFWIGLASLILGFTIVVSLQFG